MKKLVTAVTTVLVMFLSVDAIAQTDNKQNQNEVNAKNQKGKKHPKKHGKKHGAKKAIKALDLTEAQKATLKTQKVEFAKQRKEIKVNTTLTDAQKQEKLATIKATQKQKVQNVLTTEQKAKLETLKADKQKKAAEKQAAKLAKMQTNLGLTAAQVSQIKTAKSTTKGKVAEIKKNTSITKKAKKEQLKALHASAKQNFASILTPEQLKKFEETKKTKRPKQMVK